MAESACDLLDLAAISQIQNGGFLVCTHFHRDSMRLQVRNVSANIGEAMFSSTHLRHDPRLFIGKCVPDCFSASFADRMSALFQRYLSDRSARCSYTCANSNKRYFVTLTRTRNSLVFEILPDDVSPREHFQLGHDSNLRALTVHTDHAALFETACAAVTDVVDYDRAMVYQFQDDLSGKVVYERIKPSLTKTLEPYLNTFFPQSDIPLPARQMFLFLPVRVIFDTGADPVEVFGDEQDMSRCLLRANHSVHTSYLQNMGVRSSMSIGIVVKSELWGLMCFHSYEKAVYPRGREISGFENLSTQISTCLSKIQTEDCGKRQAALSTVVDRGLSTDDIFAFFAENAPDLLKLMKADCVVIKLVDRIKSWGDADLFLSETELDRVSKGATGKEWALKELGMPPRGVLCIVHAHLSVVFVRTSIAADKAWAGDPSHVKIMRPDGVPGPRGSFERYIQSGADRLNKWNAQDREMATYVSSRIKILVSTLNFFADKTDALVQAGGTDLRKGQVDYSTAKKPVVLDSALISHFSHELKTPLHGVSSVLTLLREESVGQDSDTRDQLGYGLECIKTISRVVESVLAAAGGRVHRKVEGLCLEVFVDSLSNKFAEDASFTATNTVPKHHNNVMADIDLLRETLVAIIDNSLLSAGAAREPTTHLCVSSCSTHREATMAWKNKTEGYAHRNIRNSEDTSGISESDVWFTFSVQDSGCGIHRDMLDNVLAYGDDTRPTTNLTNSHQGVGVGVYKCIANVFEMNGSIGIASTVSKGTIVSVMLPAKLVEDTRQKRAVQDVSEDVGVFFVVDDNTVNRRLASRLVKVAFQKATGVAPLMKEFADGRVCIEEINRVRGSGKKILGILMDHHMPIMSGKEATQRIRDSEARKGLAKIPIFGFTADATDSTRQELLNSGMDDVLPKPMSMKTLEETCVKMMSRAIY